MQPTASDFKNNVFWVSTDFFHVTSLGLCVKNRVQGRM